MAHVHSTDYEENGEPCEYIHDATGLSVWVYSQDVSGVGLRRYLFVNTFVFPAARFADIEEAMLACATAHTLTLQGVNGTHLEAVYARQRTDFVAWTPLHEAGWSGSPDHDGYPDNTQRDEGYICWTTEWD